MDTNSLAHTKWNCKYHIVFAPKYRREFVYGQIEANTGRILRLLYERKGVKIIEENMKHKYGNRNFWRRGYYVDTVGRNKK